ncbi:MAG TPA: DNA-directed RNA polymerase subunit beta', partial [Firmicutes bacterium]|nr:DNA-directed RNA polymerase subunit beta' [Bacillota bacterium]
MAVHVPLSAEAQAEARLLMLSTNNILVPSSGRPIVTPNQDMVIGLYYLTAHKEGAKGEGSYFGSIDEIIHAYNAGAISLHARIVLRQDDEARTRLETTAGRLFVNEILPEGMDYINHELDKKKLGNLVERLYKDEGAAVTAKVLDEIMQLGFEFSTRSGTTVSVADIAVPASKHGRIRDAEEEVEQIEAQFRRGLLTPEER